MRLWVIYTLVFLAVEAWASPPSSAGAKKASAPGPAPKVSGEVLHLTADTPVFSAPSAKSKIVADADEGSVLLLRRVSPRHTWLLIEDEDGNQGWVPQARTDYVWIDPQLKSRAPHEALPDKASEGVQIPHAPSEQKTENLFGFQHHIGIPLARFALSDPNGKLGFGFQYTLFLPGYTVKNANQSWRLYWMGLQCGLLWFPHSSAQAFSMPLRVRLLAHDSNEHFAMGPDMGALWSYEQSAGFTQNKWSLSLGYSFGYVSFASGPFALLRGGLDFFNSFRPSVELNVGWSL